MDARILVCSACAIDHAALIRDPEVAIGPPAERLNTWLERRLAEEPVSRIIGRREFWGLSFEIGAEVLDPRPETEGLVGAVLDALGGRRQEPLRLLDLGTGSGAILAALLHELPRARGVGIDRSPAACLRARANFAALGLAARADVVCGDWAQALAGCFDAVVSNPPYIPSGEIAGLERGVRAYDPLPALDGGADGLDAYRAILRGLDTVLAPGGVAAFECGWNQGESVGALARGPLAGVMVYRDMAGLDRVVIGTKV